MKLKSDAKFRGKLAQGLKNDIRNLVNFHASSRSQFCTLIGYFCRKHIKILMRKYRRAMPQDTEELWKVRRKIDSWFLK